MSTKPFNFSWLRLCADSVAAAMFAAVFILFCLKIGMRYLWHNEFAWTDELCTILFIWIIFWANSFMLSEKDHIRFDLAVRALPDGIRKYIPAIRAIVVGGIFVYSFPGTLDYIMFLWRERTPVLQLKLSYVYFCFVIYIGVIALRYFYVMVRTIAGRASSDSEGI